ncbi:ABC transporter substrate-binding protein [Paenibacillus flagellatus]|uniref:Ferrichrome ABC transporter substrate-binding protein n=1 Tax=Paenibacillus flagellatus TaxID=2211139 RepID=A0A2V5K9Z1_9BACL|nr:iron-siderophore ABC transporter substrate-binding protein [Paenibacillus flagellatus]PYI56351.1 ferrichrome ABC transporter substrate-binding protein [Paenibacillus flagellatus]
MYKWFKPLTLLMAFILILAGCGTASTDNKQGASAPAANNGAGAGNAAEPSVKTIKHAMGTTDIKGTPSKIVILEWAYAEHLLAVGVQPVGMADIAGYKKWVNAKPEPAATVIDVGTRQEPNLELIASLKPDLIVTTVIRAKTSYDKLKAIAPTIVFDPYSEQASKDIYADTIESFKTLADIVNKKPEAEKVVKDLDKLYEDARTKLKAAGKEGAEVAVTQAFSNQNAAVFRLMTDNSSIMQIYAKMGLKNAYKPEKFESQGFSTASVEALPAIQNAHFLYAVQNDDNVFEKQLKDNAVWKGLAFVKENRTYALGGDMWIFGGPLSIQKIVEKTVSVLTAK